MKFILFLIFSIGAFLFLTGFDDIDLQKEYVRQREDIRQLQEKIGQFQNDMRAMQVENETLKSEISKLQGNHAQYSKEIDRLDSLIKKLDTARQQDRKIIVEEVSREMARLKKISSSSRPDQSKENKSPKAVVEEDLEHVVKKGEYLAAIAEASGVTVKAIKEANQLKSNELRVGQKLFIPKK